MKFPLTKLLGLWLFLGLGGCGEDESVSKRSSDSTEDLQKTERDARAVFAEGCPKDLFGHSLIGEKIINTGNTGVIGDYRVELSSDAFVSRKNGSISLESTFNIESINPELARNEAQKTVDKLNGMRLGYLLESDWQEFYQANGANLVKCSLYPITQIEANTSGKKTVVNFSPAIPFLMSPGQPVELYQTEIGEGINFAKITAEVVESGISGYKVGSTFEGSLSITPVDASTEGADYAVRVQTDFGSLEKTQALGLYSDATYFIAGGVFKTIIISTGNAETPTVTYRKP